MRYEGKERRQHNALRNHVEALLKHGATITDRAPLHLVYKGQEMSIRHGILVCEPTPQELDEALDWLACGDNERRASALRICLEQLDAVLAPYPPFRNIRSASSDRQARYR